MSSTTPVTATPPAPTPKAWPSSPGRSRITLCQECGRWLLCQEE